MSFISPLIYTCKSIKVTAISVKLFGNPLSLFGVKAVKHNQGGHIFSVDDNTVFSVDSFLPDRTEIPKRKERKSYMR